MKAVNFTLNYLYMIICTLKHIFFFVINFVLFIKISENTNLTYYQRNRDLMLNKKKRLLGK